MNKKGFFMFARNTRESNDKRKTKTPSRYTNLVWLSFNSHTAGWPVGFTLFYIWLYIM